MQIRLKAVVGGVGLLGVRCDANAMESGCRVQNNVRMRLLRRIEELRKDIVAVGLGHLQQSGINEITTFGLKNEKLVKKRKGSRAAQDTAMVQYSNKEMEWRSNINLCKFLHV